MEIPSISFVDNCTPSVNPFYQKLCLFLDNVVDRFKPLSKNKDGSVISAEDQITADFSLYLNAESEKSADVFRFVNQDNKADIGVHAGKKYTRKSISNLCWIEAKRLPTPQNSERDEREYVFVDHDKKYKGNGGIERFKLNKHGINLPVSIMFGYVQLQDFSFWENRINEWLASYSKTAPFCKVEKLSPYFNKPGRYISKHTRYDVKTKKFISDFTLYHFWIDLT